MSYLNWEDDDYHLNDVISNKYIPQRQPNPYLKKYYAGRRPLPWRLSKLSSSVTGNEWDLKDYETWLWEDDKKAKVKAQRREERQRRRLENAANTGDGHEDIQTRSRKRVIKLAPSSPTTDDLNPKTGNKSKTNTKPKKRQRPQTPHLISAIKATSKRQGYLGYYTPCCCCYIYDRPRILKSQDFKRSLAMLLSEHNSSSSSSSSSARPKNPQAGRARFHEGRDKAWEQKRQRRPNDRWGTAQWGYWLRFHDGHGGRGLRGWMREERRRRVVPLGDPVDEREGAECFGLGDITREGEAAPYRVRYIVARRPLPVENGKGLILEPVEVADEPFCWGRNMEDMEMGSDGESDVWVQEEWVCLSIDGGASSEDEMTLSWIEVDDDSEGDDF